MQNTLIVVNSRKRLELFKDSGYTVYRDYKLFSDLNVTEILQKGASFTKDDLNIAPEILSLYSLFVEFSQPFSKIILVVNPGHTGDFAAGFLAYLFKKSYKKILRIKMHHNTTAFFDLALKKAEPVHAGLLYAACAAHWANLKILGEFKKINSVKGTSDLTHIKQALMLRHLYERENEIESQKKSIHYHVGIRFKVRGKKTVLFRVTKLGKEELDIQNIQLAKAMISELKTGEFKIIKHKRQENKVQPPRPYTTVSLLKDAEYYLRYPVNKVLKILEHLYTGIEMGEKGVKSLLTFYLTQSDYIKTKAVQDLREYIYNNYGADYLPARAIKQDRHHTEGEAIHPVDIKLVPRKVKKYLDEKEYNIYKLVWQRYVASQMSKSVSETVCVTAGDDKEEQCLCEFEYQVELFRGYKQVFSIQDEFIETIKLPDTWQPGKVLSIEGFDIQSKENENTERYSEPEMLQLWMASGSGTVEEFFNHSGILFANQILDKKRFKLFPTAKGFYAINALLSKYSGYINNGIILQLDNLIQTVATGKQNYNVFVSGIDKLFEGDGRVQSPRITIGGKDSLCPICGGNLIQDTDGKIICEHYPDRCVYIYIAKGDSVNDKCEVCGARLLVREGQYGRFLACSRYPKCSFTKAYTLNISCPDDGCDGKVVERTSKGRLFYGCSRYPDCSFAAWKKPVNMLCRFCGNRYLVEYEIAEGLQGYQCPKCNHLFDEQFVEIFK